MKKLVLLSLLFLNTLVYAQNLKIVEINHKGTEVCLEVLNLDSMPGSFKVITHNSSGSVCATCATDQTNYTVAGNDIVSVTISGTLGTNYGFWLDRADDPFLPACNTLSDCWVSINGSVPSEDYTEEESFNAGNENTNPITSLQFSSSTNQWVENVEESCGVINGPLPVELSSFSARTINDDKHVLLEWATNSESQNRGFYIQKLSSDSQTYQDIVFVPSQAEQGNSQIAIEYSYVDTMPSYGINRYRLKQVDIDQQITLSHIITARIENVDLNGYTVYPNPSAGIISVDEALVFDSITVSSQSGHIILLRRDSELRDFDISNQKNGVYYVKITKDLQSKTVKIILQR